MSGTGIPGGRQKLAVLLLGALLFLPALGRRDLWSRDTARDAEAARQMAAHGDVLVPSLNLQPLLDRPPLHIWLIALAGRALGRVSEFAVRMPSALTAIGALLLVFSLARDWFDPPAAWVAVAVLATAPRFLWLARSGGLGMLLLFLTLLAVWLWSRSYDQSRPAFSLVFFAACGLTGLAGGVAALSIPLLTVAIFLVWTRDGEKLRELHPEWGIGICALILAAWSVPATAAAGRSVYPALAWGLAPASSFDSFLRLGDWSHNLQEFALGFLPWCLLLPGAIIVAVRELKGESRKRVLVLVCWTVAAILLAFVGSPGDSLLVSAYPALAVMIGAGASGLRTAGIGWRHGFGLPLLVAAVAMTASAILIPFADDLLPESFRWRPPATTATSMALLVLVAAGLWVAWWWARSGRPGTAIASAAAGMGCAALVAATVLLPTLNRSESVRPLSAVFLEQSTPIQPFATYPSLDARVLFYTGRTAVPLRDARQLYRYAHAAGRKWLFIDERTLDSLPQPLPLDEVGRAGQRDRRLVLLTDPPTGRPAPGHN